MFDSPVVSVHIPPALRVLAGGHDEITASGDTVGEVLDAIGHEYPAMRGRLLQPGGDLSPEVVVYLGANSLSDLQGLATPIALEEVVSILMAR